MSYTNKTTNLELPQYIGTDIPSILTDTNQTYAKIDSAYGEINNSVTEAVQVADQAKSLASAAQSQAQAASNEITALTSRVKTVETTLESTEEIAATAKSTAESAQSTANDATSTANTATSKAATAQSTANAAQSTANTANNLANTTNAKVDALKEGRSGVVASVRGFNFVKESKSYNAYGSPIRLWYTIQDEPGYGEYSVGLIISKLTISTSNLLSVNVSGVDIYPLMGFSGNVFNTYADEATQVAACELLDNSTHTINKTLPCYLWYNSEDNTTYIGVSLLSASYNNYIVQSTLPVEAQVNAG